MDKGRKNAGMAMTRVGSKKRSPKGPRKRGGQLVHFATPLDICHLRISELEPEVQKYKGRVLIRGDIVKDDFGSYVVFTEQGSSASQVTATKVMDVIGRLPGCAGQAAEAVSACTQVRVSRHLDTSPTTHVAKIIIQH